MSGRSVLIIVPGVTIGGAQKNFTQLFKSLQQQKVDVHMLSLSTNLGALDFFDLPYPRFVFDWNKYPAWIRRLPFSSPLVILSFLVRSYILLRPSLLYSFQTTTNWYVFLSSLFFSHKIILCERNSPSRSSHYLGRIVSYIPYFFASISSFNSLEQFVFFSSLPFSRFGRPVLVSNIRPKVNPSQASYQESCYYTLVFVSRDVPHKNLDLFVDLCRRFDESSHVSAVAFTVSQRSIDLTGVRIPFSLRLFESPDFSEFVNPIMVFLSLYEGSPNVLIEASSNSVPIVSFSLQSILGPVDLHLAQSFVSLVPPGDLVSLQKSCLALMSRESFLLASESSSGFYALFFKHPQLIDLYFLLED